MCACEPEFVCDRCEDTPADDRYEENEPEPEAFAFGERFTEQDA